MPVLFLSSVVFALGYTVIAYRASCRARRKHMLHRMDPESVLSSKNLFSYGYAKVPRSPTPTAGRTPNSDTKANKFYLQMLGALNSKVNSLLEITATAHGQLPPFTVSATIYRLPPPRNEKSISGHRSMQQSKAMDRENL